LIGTDFKALDFHSISDESYSKILNHLYSLSSKIQDESISCQKSYFRIIMYHQGLESIENSVNSLAADIQCTDRNIDLNFLEIKIRMIFLLAGSVDAESSQILFCFILDLFAQSAKTKRIDRLAIQNILMKYIESFMEA